MKSLSRIAVALLLGLSLFPIPAWAGSPYEGYVYDIKDNAPKSINGYLYKDSIDGYELETGPFNTPEDIFVADDDTLYIVDSANNRIIHMNADKKVLDVIAPEDGKGVLATPKGVYVTKEGDVYVADTGNSRVVQFNKDGRYVKEFKKPESPLLGEGFNFSPSKLTIDKRGYLFVVSEGAHQGLVQLRPDGSFAGFFGANHVDFSWTRMLVKFIATKEQKEQIASEKPPEFSNLFQDQEGFIYTTTFGIRYDQIKRLSAVGVDILNPHSQDSSEDPKRYGDIHMPVENWQPLFEAFVDLTVDRNGVITAIDQMTGKAFQYDQLGNLLFIFGGQGNQDGLFKTPSAIDQTSDGTIYVVDKTRNRIDRFRVTPFAVKVHEATKLYVDGRYAEAMKPWQEVLRMNSNYDLAYKAIGKALYKAERYEEAMAYYKAGRARDEYSEAFLEYRKIWMRRHFGEILGAAVLIYLAYRIGKWLWKRERNRKLSGSQVLTKGGA